MRSMTGFGAGGADASSARVTVEIRSVNQRFLDVRVAAPREYAAWEGEVRDRVRERAQRGRVDVTVGRVAIAARRRYTVSVRIDLARTYVKELRQMARALDLDATLSLRDVFQLPDLLEVSERPPDLEPERRALRRALDVALRVFDRERRREGEHLRRDMAKRVARLRQMTVRVRRRLPHALAALRAQVEERFLRLLGGGEVDPARVAQEVALLGDRSDVTEELVRLEGHLVALAKALGERGPVGKRVEFLLQEVHRELNTTGAKAGDREIGEIVLGAKGEVEKLREQVQNVE